MHNEKLYDNEYKVYYTVGSNHLDTEYLYDTIEEAQQAQSIAEQNQQTLKEIRERVTSNPDFKKLMDEWSKSNECWKIELPEDFYKFWSLAFYRRDQGYCFYTRLYKDVHWEEYEGSLCFLDENDEYIDNNYAPMSIPSYLNMMGDDEGWTEENIVKWFHKKLDDEKLCKEFDLYIERHNVLWFEDYYIIMKEID